MITNQRPVMLPVVEKQVHSDTFASLFFEFSTDSKREFNMDFKPGQFVMAWIPGLDEKPYTISHYSPDRFAITVEAKGRFFQAGRFPGHRRSDGIPRPFWQWLQYPALFPYCPWLPGAAASAPPGPSGGKT